MTSKEGMTIGKAIEALTSMAGDGRIPSDVKQTLCKLALGLVSLQERNSEYVRQHRSRKRKDSENQPMLPSLALVVNNEPKEEPSRYQEYVDQFAKDFLQVKGWKYRFNEKLDGRAMKKIIELSEGNLEDASNRWRFGFVFPDQYYRIASIHELVEKERWNRFAGAEWASINGAM